MTHRPQPSPVPQQQSFAPPAYPAPPISPGLRDEGPKVINVNSGETVHQRVLLLFGRIGNDQSPVVNGNIIIHHHLEGATFPSTQWPVSQSYFKALVHLTPGTNVIRLEFSDGRTKASSHWNVNYVPLLQHPPLHLVIMVAKDSPAVFDSPPERKQAEGNNLEVAKDKFRMAAYMWQAFTGEQMRRNGFGSRCFRLDEQYEWDSLSYCDRHTGQPVKRNTAHVHVIRSSKTIKEIQDADIAQQNPKARDQGALFGIFLEALQQYGGPFDGPCWVAGLILDTKWDPKIKLIRAHAALGGGSGTTQLGMCGSHTLWAWPRFIEEIPHHFMDETRNDTRYTANDLNECGTAWEALNIGQGAHMHEVGHCLSLPHQPTGVMLRGYVNYNRTFMTKEGYSERTKSRGTPLVLPQQEDGSHWHRLDIMRFRYHPCFRLADDAPLPPSIAHDSPTALPIETGVILVCQAGITLIEIHVNDQFKQHIEYTSLDASSMPPKELYLELSEVMGRCGASMRDKVRLEIIARSQGQHTIDDLGKLLRESIVQIPGTRGNVIKGSKLGPGNMQGSQRWTGMFVSPPSRSPMPPRLVNIRVHAGAALDGLVFQYSDGTNMVCGKTGGSANDFPMQGNETITGFSVRAGAWVDGVQIHTTSRSSPWYGGTGGGMHKLEPPRGYSLVGIYGSAGGWCDSFGIVYKVADEPIDHLLGQLQL